MDFDTTAFDGGDISWIYVWKNQWGVQSDNAYREIVKQLLTPYNQWPPGLQTYVVYHASEEPLGQANIPYVQIWANYKPTLGMISLGRIVSRFFGHTPPQ